MPEIGTYVEIVRISGIQKIAIKTPPIFGIPIVGTSFTFRNSLDFGLVCRK